MTVRITVSVPPSRDRSAWARLAGARGERFEGIAVVTTDADHARRHGNPQRDPLRPGGHAPFGRYQLVGRAATPSEAAAEYGGTLLLFEPASGEALDAESFGRLALLMYSGGRGADGRLRPTQGGARLAPDVMQALLAATDTQEPIELVIEPLAAPRWWAFWRRRELPPPPSSDGPRFTQPPLDEQTLAASVPRTIARAPLEDRDADTWRDDRDRDSSSGSSDTPYRGGGGTGGGGGASASWSDARVSGRGTSVDASGRVIAAAAVAAVAAGAAVAAARSDAEGSTAGHGDAGGSGNDSGGTSTESGTAY